MRPARGPGSRLIERRPADPQREVVLRYVHPADAERERLDVLITRLHPSYPKRAGARKACERGEVGVNGLLSESCRWVLPGDEITAYTSAREPPPPLERWVRVAYEDEWMAVVEKPAGLPTNGPYASTLERALPFNLAASPRPDALPAPRCVHRLDAQTSGCLVVAKTSAAHAALGQAFEARRVHKRYRALVVGRLEGQGAVDAPIDGREARTEWAAVEHTRVLECGWITTVDLVPHTGRTHQLRRHLAALGHPILGDGAYGTGAVLRGKGLFLHASAVDVPHPATGERVAITSDEPPKFAGYRARQAARVARAP